jgi:hypothetical protein
MVKMPLQIHDIELADNSQIQNQDRLVLGQQFNIANPAGGGAGASVTVAVSFTVGSLPTNYAVLAEPNQNCLSYVAAKTNNGFNVILTPSPATATLAAGKFNVAVFG